MNKHTIKIEIQLLYWWVFYPSKYKEGVKIVRQVRKACNSDEVQAAMKEWVEAVFNKVKSKEDETR